MPKLFDIKAIEAEAQAEVADEEGKVAKGKIKASLQTIAACERALANARLNHEALLRTIAE